MSVLFRDQLPSGMFTSDYLQGVYDQAHNVLPKLRLATSKITDLISGTQQELGNTVEVASYDIVFPRENGSLTFDFKCTGLTLPTDYHTVIPQAACRHIIEVNRPRQGRKTHHVVSLAWMPVVKLHDTSQHDDPEVTNVTYYHEYFIVNPKTSKRFSIFPSDALVQYPEGEIYLHRNIKKYVDNINKEIGYGDTGYTYSQSNIPHIYVLNDGFERWARNVDICQT